MTTISDRLGLVVREAQQVVAGVQLDRAAFYERKAALLEDLGDPDLAAQARVLAQAERVSAP